MDKFNERYKKLNKKQKRSVDSIEGPVLVVAGPGSGKTETLSLRAVNILKKTDVFPKNILCLTFTDSAAVNMRERLKTMIGKDAYKIATHTFHSFGESIKNYHPEAFYKGAMFSSIDELTQVSLIEKIFKKLSYNDPLRSMNIDQGYVYSWLVIKAIQYLKKAGITPNEFSQILEYNKKAMDFLNPYINDVFSKRVSKKIFKEIFNIIKEMGKYSIEKFPVEHVYPLERVIVESLKRVLKKSINEDKTNYISEWKKENTYKRKNGDRVLKDNKNLEKMESLANVYKTYQEEMYRQGYYDFDDMILDVIMAIEKK